VIQLDYPKTGAKVQRDFCDNFISAPTPGLQPRMNTDGHGFAGRQREKLKRQKWNRESRKGVEEDRMNRNACPQISPVCAD